MKSIVQCVVILGVSFLLYGCSKTNPKIELSNLPQKSLAPICKDLNTSVVTYDTPLPQDSEPELPLVTTNVSDLEHFPQTLTPYLEYNFTNQEAPYEIQKRFEEQYYTPWSYSVAPICSKEAQWPIGAFVSGYGSNLKRVDASWISELVDQSNFLSFSTINKPAITTKWMNMRVFPTQKPLYRNPALPGEGYPFDLLQNSSVAFNEPIFVSHYSKDGSWVYVFTNNASGWVESDGVALITQKEIKLIHEKEKVFITQDRIPLNSQSGEFIAYTRIGMVLPLSEETPAGYKVLFFKNNGAMEEMTVPKGSARIGAHLLTKDDLLKVGTYLLRNTYGWGGMFEERDCSSMIRDFLTPFGIWLPRNSASQAKKGEVISFDGLDNNQKIALIKAKAIPFETIFYKKGHVLLYIGTYENNVMAMHNIWGIRTIDSAGKKGRVIVGKAVISTLELGKEVENFDANNMLLSKLVSMNIFTHSAVAPIARQKGKIKLSKL